jgi:hypothetical protein
MYFSFYWGTLKRLKALIPSMANDGRMFAFAVATMGFLVYMMLLGTYNFWLENGRLATILWAMVAMVLRYGELKASESASVLATPDESITPSHIDWDTSGQRVRRSPVVHVHRLT